MPLDAICLAAVRDELAGQITGMKIEKVQQPERDVLVLLIRGSSGQQRLLISAGTGDARVHLTEHRFENPESPPMFCMLLRKHLSGARIVGITQPSSERLLDFTLDAPDAMGVLSEKHLIIELIGRQSNIILTGSDGIITDCLRRVGGEMTDKRAILPGLKYHRPPVQEGKLDPAIVSGDEWQSLFNSAGGLGGAETADKWLLAAFTALSPLVCREISWRAYSDTDIRLDAITDGGAALRREFFAVKKIIETGSYEPWVIFDANNEPRDFSFMRILQYESALTTKSEESFSIMLDRFFSRKSQLARISQKASATSRAVKSARDRIARKLAAQQAELGATADRERLRECGDIITANLHAMSKGQRILTAPDFFSENETIREIILDPLKTPQQNAAKYYKDYTRSKNAEKYLTKQILSGENELIYLDSVLEELALAESERDLAEIRRELVQTGYIKAQKPGKEKQPAQAEPARFASSAGLMILAGRNNLQNDMLTLKTALRSDIWLHAQKTHGSHVIISCGGNKPDETTLLEAAAIAAFYSTARSAGKVAVDYAEVRHVKKPQGGRPGMVIYTDYKTIIAVPDESVINRLRI